MECTILSIAPIGIGAAIGIGVGTGLGVGIGIVPAVDPTLSHADRDSRLAPTLRGDQPPAFKRAGGNPEPVEAAGVIETHASGAQRCL